eukprot:7897309-Pyramimonas_sp.AAC.1
MFVSAPPVQYAALLAEKMHRHHTQAWLVNTGWTGGRYGVGHRMKLQHTRAIVDAIHSGALAQQALVDTPVFNLKVPKECPGVPAEVLVPANQWADPEAFEATLTDLGRMFEENFDKYRRARRFYFFLLQIPEISKNTYY